MISRIWHGYTTPENADTYETLLKGEVIVGIKDRSALKTEKSRGSAKSRYSAENWGAR